MRSLRGVTTFGLVHGAWHGAWCWDLVRAELSALGHRGISVDLPCDDPAVTLEDNRDLLLDSLADAGDDVVLVAHSFGGPSAALVAAARPVRALVYVAAFIPEPGYSMAATLRRWPGAFHVRPKADPVTHDDGSSHWEHDAAIEIFFHDCAPEIADWAATMLRRQDWTTMRQTCPLESEPDVPTTVVVCRDDRALRAEWCAQIGRTLLGVEPVELEGSHSPFLSRPAELARLLVGVEQR